MATSMLRVHEEITASSTSWPRTTALHALKHRGQGLRGQPGSPLKMGHIIAIPSARHRRAARQRALPPTIRTASRGAGALANLPICGKVVSTAVGRGPSLHGNSNLISGKCS
jgi:hypothetical protein